MQSQEISLSAISQRRPKASLRTQAVATGSALCRQWNKKKKENEKKMKEMHSPSVLMKTQFDHHCEGSERQGSRSQTTLTR